MDKNEKPSSSAALIAHLLFLTVTLGQLVRLTPFSQSASALIAVDVATALIALGTLLWATLTGRIGQIFRSIAQTKTGLALLLFIGWSLIGLIISTPRHPVSEIAVGYAYDLRLLGVYWLGVVAWAYQPIRQRTLSTIFVIWGAALLLLGYLQFIFVKDFSFMTKFGWDPHYGRMLSTFFDPNFFGIFLVLLLCIVLAQVFTHQGRARYWYLLVFAAAFGGLFLTYSRSAWIAGAFGLVPLGFWRHWKVGLLMLAIFAAGLLIPSRLSNRLRSASSVLTQEQQILNQRIPSSEVTDPSGAARLISYKGALSVFQTSPVFGVGYDFYGSALVKIGLADSQGVATNMSSQGADSSLLTILATTGLVGLAAFGATVSGLTICLWRRNADRANWTAAALGWFMIAWLVGSFFVNSLLYILIAVPAVVLIGSELHRSNRP